MLGTGWQGELPPEDYARYLPDARERFSDQPPHYFPPHDGTFIPQQTYDQVLFQLGLVGAALFLVLVAARGAPAIAAGAALARRGDGRAGVPAGRLARVPRRRARRRGALRRRAADRAIFWLTLGVVGRGAALAGSRHRA